MSELVIARNPDPDSALPVLLRVPVDDGSVVLLKTKDSWPRTSKLYCHPMDAWPADAEIVERHPLRACSRRGAAIDLLLDRSRESRSQIVFTRARGRTMVFWQTARTSRQARPSVALPTRRASGEVLEVLVDTRERYPYRFAHQQATTRRRALRAGDYAVEVDGTVVGAVERKSLADLATSLTTGRLTYALVDLVAVPHRALVVEDRYSALFKLEHVAGGTVAEALAETQARFPGLTVMWAETRGLAEEWTYRFLGAALAEQQLKAAQPAPAAPDPAHVRRWAAARGLAVNARGRLPRAIVEAYRAAHP